MKNERKNNRKKKEKNSNKKTASLILFHSKETTVERIDRINIKSVHVPRVRCAYLRLTIITTHP